MCKKKEETSERPWIMDDVEKRMIMLTHYGSGVYIIYMKRIGRRRAAIEFYSFT